MVKRILIRSTDGVAALEFAEPRLTARNHFSCAATLVLEGEEPSSVELTMITPYRSMWFEFFRSLANHLDGWSGPKVWSSEFSELTLTCVNDGSGQIEMTVAMWPDGAEWGRNATLWIRREEIARIHEDLRLFLGLRSEQM